MGETTGIAWTRSTINVWHGCDKVSPGCKHCYAEVSTPIRVKRAKGLEVWGKGAARDETNSWEKNLRTWAREAVTSAVAPFWPVFGQSLSDTFEDRRDLDSARRRFFSLIDAWECRSLTFQLLTKRPENVLRMVPASWLKSWPGHVWIGCTVEDQKRAEERIPHLLRVPAAVRFLSVEPQLGPIDLTDLVRRDGAGEHHYDALHCDVDPDDDGDWNGATISWVIQGGESGPRARPFDLAWARALRDQCRAASVPYFLKQLGAQPMMRADSIEERRAGIHPETEWPDGTHFGGGAEHGEQWRGRRAHLHDSHGGDESEWPADLRGCRAFPVVRHG